MIIDLFVKILKKDPLFKRNLVKTISWRIAGSIDTMVLCWVITGRFSTGAKIGALELLTKMLLYYIHERFWQGLTFELPSKLKQAQIIRQEIKPTLFKQVGKITRQDREILNKGKSFTLWLTGLSGSGKSTLATEVESWIHGNLGRVYILDGDNTRLGINSDLSFSAEDRAENIRRVAEMCRLFNDAGIIVIASFISPFIEDRLLAKNIISTKSFIEVFTDSNISVCQERDTKGLYKMAFEGKIKNFTGVSSPYEQPPLPDLHLHTGVESIDTCVVIIQKYLTENNFIKITG